jgi:hypothetical protein
MNPTRPKARAWAQPGQVNGPIPCIRWVEFSIIVFTVRLFLHLVVCSDRPAFAGELGKMKIIRITWVWWAKMGAKG